MLSFNNYQVGRSKQQILMDLQSEKGKSLFEEGIHLLIAPNGYGKSTFFQTLSGMIPALSGKAFLNGQPLAATDIRYFSEYLAYPKWIRASEWVSAWSQKRDLEFLDPFIKALKFEKLWNGFLGQMSQGERRKVIWLTALAVDAKILLLDEPTRGLDFPALAAIGQFFQEFKKQSRIVLTTSHEVTPILGASSEIWVLQKKAWVPFQTVLGKDPRKIPYSEFLDGALKHYR